jgi:hypothetical protein
MTQPRPAGATKRAPIQSECYPDWRAPRLLRKSEPKAGQTVRPPQEIPVSPPERQFVPAPRRNLGLGGSIRSESEIQQAPPLRLAAPIASDLATGCAGLDFAMCGAPTTLDSRSAAGFRDPSLSLLSLLSVFWGSDGPGAAYLIVLRFPVTSERMSAPIDSASRGLRDSAPPRATLQTD